MEKVSFEIEINGVTKSINSINEAKEAISELQDIMDNSTFGSEEFKNAATQIDKLQNKLVEALDKGVEPATDGFKKLKNELKEAKNAQAQAAEAFGEGSKEYKAAAQQVANLQDKLDDLKDSSVSLKGTGVERLNSSVGLLREGFQNFDTDKLKIGFNALGTAMKAIPIFLIIEGLRLLWENFDKVSEFAKKFFNLQSDGEKQITKLNKQLKEQEDATKALSGSIEREIKLLEAQGASTEKIIEAKKRLALEQLKELDLQGKLAVAKIREIASNDDATESVYKYAAALARAQGNTQAAEIWERKYTEAKRERMSEEVKNANEINEKIKNIGNSIQVEELKVEKAQSDARKKSSEERAKLLQEAIDAENALKVDKDRVNNLLINENLKTNLEERNAIELQGEQSLLNGKIEAEEAYQQVLREKQRSFRDAQLEEFRQENNARLSIVETYSNAAQGLSDFVYQTQLNNVKKGSEEEDKIKRKQFETNKKIQIAQAFISGSQGLLNAITQRSGVPIPFDIPLRIAKSAAVVTTTAATIAKINSQQYGGGGGQLSGNTGVPAVSGNAPQFNSIAPNINPAANQPLTRLDENGRPINVNTSVKVEAEVTESKMTDKQKQQQQRINNTTF